MGALTVRTLLSPVPLGHPPPHFGPRAPACIQPPSLFPLPALNTPPCLAPPLLLPLPPLWAPCRPQLGFPPGAGPAAMDLLFGRRKTPEELLRQNQRALNRAMRELDRERQKLETQEKKIIADIKKMAKQGQMVSSGRRRGAGRPAAGGHHLQGGRCFQESGREG